MPKTKLKPEPIYQAKAICPCCQTEYDIDHIHLSQTCPYCYVVLKVLPKERWTVKSIVMTQR